MTAEHNYIRDVLAAIIQRAKEAKEASNSTKGNGTTEQQAFDDGRALAYYEVVSTLLNEAAVFGLSSNALPELDFDADAELL